MVKSLSPRLGQTRWSSGTDTVRRTDFDSDAEKLDSLVALYGQGTLALRPAAGVQGKFYMTTGEADPKANGRLFYDNGSGWSANRYMTDAVVESTAATNSGLIVRAANGQSADVFSVNNYSAVSLFRVTSSGVVSNQSTVGVSAGVYMGKINTHDAALSAISVDPTKPVLVATGAAGQTASLLTLRNSSSVNVFNVNANGDGLFNGTVTATRFISGGVTSTPTMEISDGLVTKNLFSSPKTANDAAATFTSFPTNPQANTIDFMSGGRVARITQDGTFATNGRLIAGNNQGNKITQAFLDTDPTLGVVSLKPNSPVARFVGIDGQSANLIEAASNGTNKFIVDTVGNITASGNVRVASVSVGAPLTQWFSGYQPIMEVNTGSASGTYRESLVVRHSVQDATAVGRELGLFLKLSNEASTTESDKYAGISARSSLANAATPSLVFYSGGAEVGTFNPTGNLVVNNVLYSAGLRTGETSTDKMHWSLSPNATTSMGVQTGGSFYTRAPKFYWYSGGTYNATAGNDGGGAVSMRLDGGADNRLTVGRISITDTATYDSATPMLQIGTQTGSRIQFNNVTMSAWSGNELATLNIQPNGGTLNLGSAGTRVVVAGRTLYLGGNRIYFGGSTWDAVGGAPVANDWWFDHTNNQIKVRNDVNQWKVLADDSMFG